LRVRIKIELGYCKKPYSNPKNLIQIRKTLFKSEKPYSNLKTLFDLKKSYLIEKTLF